jgi:hypothetical protein
MPAPDLLEPAEPAVMEEARRLHAAGPLQWMRFNQLDPETIAEYLARAERDERVATKD